MEDIETKMDVLLDMYKEDRSHHHQSESTSSSAQQHQLDDDDVRQRRTSAAAAAAGHQRLQSSEPCSPCQRTVSELQSPSSRRQRERAKKPMLRNLSDLEPRVKKRVTYSVSDASDRLQHRVTLDCRSHGHAAEPVPRQQPSIVGEEEEEGQQGAVSRSSCVRQQQQQALMHDGDGRWNTSAETTSTSQSDVHCSSPVASCSSSVDAAMSHLLVPSGSSS